MTVTVERFHDCPVNVKVLESTTQGDHYSRKIILTRQSDDVVVMFGIVRLDMSVLSPEVRAEIEAKETPLGRILIKHDVWRVVKLLNLFKIEAGDDLIASMKRSSDDVFFGRTALIYCDGSPAIELLEVVAQ
jgi:chorismate-pyruvate lyase